MWRLWNFGNLISLLDVLGLRYSWSHSSIMRDGESSTAQGRDQFPVEGMAITGKATKNRATPQLCFRTSVLSLNTYVVDRLR